MTGRNLIRYVDYPAALIVGGALFGGIGWYIPSSWVGVPLIAHIVIVTGFALRPTYHRLILAFTVTFLMWWPFWARGLIWSDH